MSSRVITVTFILACAAVAAAQPVSRTPVAPWFGSQTGQPPRDEPLRDTMRVIVEFREPVTGETDWWSTSSVHARREAAEVRVPAFRRDLERIHDRSQSRTAPRTTAASASPRIDRVFSRVLFGASVEVRRELVQDIRLLPYVKAVHEDRVVKPFLTDSVASIRAPEVWETKGTRGNGIVVAVLDTGIDYRHAAFGGGFGTGFKVRGGWDFVDDDADPIDLTGHGTHVAAIIAGNGGGLVGVAPEATLLAYRVLGASGGYVGDVIAGIEYAVDPDQNGDPSDHADIINLSLGGAPVKDDPLIEAVENATAAGVLFCVAAGNTSLWGDIGTPALAPSAIAVGATDDDDAIATFSSRGPALDYSIKPEVVAPGVDIVSAFPDGKTYEASGTSMATPHVAGVAALLKSLHRDWTPEQLKAAIMNSSQPLDTDVMAAGAGRVDALRAATIATLITPPRVDFGAIDANDETWSATRTLTLRNLTAEAQTLTAAIPGVREGVTLQVTPASLNIAAGESATVSVEIAVTNAAVPAPREGSLSFGGRIEWTGGAHPVHVPWAFVKGAFLIIEVADPVSESYAQLIGQTSGWGTDWFWDQTVKFWPLEKVDVVVSHLGRYSSTRRPEQTIIAEEVDLAVNPHVVVRRADARFEIVPNTTGPDGNSLKHGDRSCAEEIVFAFPHGVKVSREWAPDWRNHFGPISERVKIYLAESCADIGTETVYAAIHEPWAGLTSSRTSTTHPQWQRQEVRFDGPESHMTVVRPVMLFPGPGRSYFLDGGGHFLMRPTRPQLTYFLAPSPAPEVELFSYLNRWGKCPSPDLPDAECAFIDRVYVYFRGNEVWVEGDIYPEVSSMAYRVPLGTTFTLGTTPVFGQTGMFIIEGRWGASSLWMGALSEVRARDASTARVVIRDEAGSVLAEGVEWFVRDSPLHGTVFEVESTSSNYAIAGRNGTSMVRVRFDLAKADLYHPQLTGLRIVDGSGRQVTSIAPDSEAALLFSVADHYRDGVYLRRQPPREEATRVEYRTNGTGSWKPLAPQLVGRHIITNNSWTAGVGTIYRVDLAALTREVRGTIGFRFHAEDHEGNSIDLQVEPAVYVGETGRRRAARH